MVEMGTIRKEGFTGVPLLLGANIILTEAVATAIPSADRERRSPGPTAVLISCTGNGRSSADAVEFVALIRHLRLACRLGGEPDVRDRHYENTSVERPG
jgi:hypothetical protein